MERDNQQQQDQQQGDSQEDLDRALQRQNEDLVGDMETNRNLSGSTTYETLEDQEDESSGEGQR
jgi:hypothetical protein